jgi:predicted S18 family serine protease
VTVKPDLVELADFRAALVELETGLAGLPFKAQLQRYSDLIELHLAWVKWWAKTAEKHQNDGRIPEELVEAARREAVLYHNDRANHWHHHLKKREKEQR